MTEPAGPRSIDQLVVRDDPAWPLVLSWASDPEANPSRILPPDPQHRDPVLLRLQVTTRSPLGAIVYESGGIALHGGWLRLLGSGRPTETGDGARSLVRWNEGAGAFADPETQPAFLLVADDILGGFFALNGGRFGPDGLGQVFYLAPDGLAWEPLELSHTDFVHWCFFGDTRAFYADLSGLCGWDERPCPGFDQAFSFYPFPWSAEAGGGVSRRAVPIDELWRLKSELAG
ncbi:DUF2625 family protein [Methylorubrum podarium]|uniref:DUF2625 family protein n=1 Tax=Methylorubrum podarium TaxID=200476 RepID=A0ABV1QVC7_9HYPH